MRSHFEEVQESYSNGQQAYTVGILSLGQLQALTSVPEYDVSPVLIEAVEEYLTEKIENEKFSLVEIN